MGTGTGAVRVPKGHSPAVTTVINDLPVSRQHSVDQSMGPPVLQQPTTVVAQKIFIIQK